MEPVRFGGQIRYWNPERSSGLAVVDVPPPLALSVSKAMMTSAGVDIGDAAEFVIMRIGPD